MNGIIPSCFSCDRTYCQEFKEGAIITGLALAWIIFIGSVLGCIVLQNAPLGPLNVLFSPLSSEITYSLFVGSFFSLAIMHGLFFQNLPDRVPLTLHQKTAILHKIWHKKIPHKLLAGHFWTFHFEGIYLAFYRNDEGNFFLARFKEESKRQKYIATKNLNDGRSAFEESQEINPEYVEAKFGKEALYQSIFDFSLDDLEVNEKIAWKYRTESKSIPKIHILAVRGLISVKMLYFRQKRALLEVSNRGYRHFENRVDKDMEMDIEAKNASISMKKDHYMYYKLKSNNGSRFVVTWNEGGENKSLSFCHVEKLETFVQRFYDVDVLIPISKITTYYV